MPISVNENAFLIVKQMIARKDELQLNVSKSSKGATVIDAGVAARGGYTAGLMITRICMGGLSEVNLSSQSYGDIDLPAISVSTDQPPISTLAAQFAGWEIKSGDYFGMGSGPARALALKPKDIYTQIDYEDQAEHAVLVLESEKLPSEDALACVASECGVKLKNTYVIVTPTNSVAGSVQISGRIVEIGIFKLRKLGLDPKTILYGFGSAPIASLHPKSTKSMGRTNDVLYYGGTTYYTLTHEDDEKLKEIVAKAPSATAAEYGRPFYEIFKDSGFNFYKIDENLFAPAVVSVNNVNTGMTLRSGRMNNEVLKEALGMPAT